MQDLASAEAQPEAESAAATRAARLPSAAPAELQNRVLTLQRSAGNHAVQRLARAGRLAGGASRRQLQRFVGWEHERLGNAGSVFQLRSTTQRPASPIVIEVAPGVRLTWGQIVALAGDEFETVEELQYFAAAAGAGGTGDAATRGRLRAAIHHDLEENRPASAGSAAVPPGIFAGDLAGQQAAARANESHFNELAFRNLEHFPDEGRAQDAWRRHHHRAVVEALEAGRGSPGRSLNNAYLYEAFGDHFLTDCFSAGHIRTPRSQIVRWYENIWKPRAKEGVKWFLLGQYLQHQIVSPEMMLDSVRRWGPTLNSALNLLFVALTPAVAGAVSGTIHDYEGDQGVLVSAPATLGAPWTTYGDNTLPGVSGRAANRTSGQAEQLAVQAIALAREHIETAYVVGRQLAAEGDSGQMSAAYARLAQRGVDYPYSDVLWYVPTAVAARTPMPWSQWRWGAMDQWMYDRVNAYARAKINANRAKVVGSLPDLTIQIDDRPPFNIRTAVDDALRNFAVDPLGAIGTLIAWPALDPQHVPVPATTTP